MAEVSGASARGLSPISSNKLSSFNINGSSSKHIYDGVFSSKPLKDSGFILFSDDEYAEMFDSSCCSIPILELDQRSRVSSGVGCGFNYSGVFGEVEENHLLDDGIELFHQLNKKFKSSSPSSVIPRDHGRQSQNGQAATNGLRKSFDGWEHLKQKNNGIPTNGTNGEIDPVHFQAIPPSLLEVGSSQNSQTCKIPFMKADTELGMNVNPEKKGNHSRNISSDHVVMELKREHDAVFLKPSDLDQSDQSNSASKSHATLQPTVKTNDATDVHTFPSSTYSQHEKSSSPKIQSSGIPWIKANTELCTGTNQEKKGKHFEDTSSDVIIDEKKNDNYIGSQKVSGSIHATNQPYTLVGPSKVVMDDAHMEANVNDDISDEESSVFGVNKQNCEDEATSQKELGRRMSISQATSSNKCQASCIDRSLNVVENDAEVGIAFDVGKKQGRHLRMTSVDFGGYGQAHDHDAMSQKKSRLRGSYSFDASNDHIGGHTKVYSPKVVPSSSSTQFFPSGSYYKISKDSYGKTFSPPSLDEQLDMNSAAATSATVLKRALDEAEMTIQLAKEFLERESEGSSGLRFKDTLRIKIMTEEENEIYEFRQKYLHVNSASIGDVLQASHFENENVKETAQVVPLLEDREIFPKSDEPILEENVKELNFIEESDKRGGEWDATRHLNQLITGVKNSFASFMAWHADKKEEPKTVEASGKVPQQLKKKEEPIKVKEKEELTEVKETEKIQNAVVCAGKTKLDEVKAGLIPHARMIEENDTTSNIAENKTVDDKEDMMPKAEGSIGTSFLFFSFNSEKSWNPPPPEVEKRRDLESWKLGIGNRPEQVVYEATSTCAQGKRQETAAEEFDDVCKTQDCGKSLIVSSDEETDEMEEAHHSTIAQDISYFACEENDTNRLNQYHEVGILPHKKDNDTSINEDCKNDSSIFEECQNNIIVRDVNEECRNSRSENQECGDVGINLAHDEDLERRVNEECGNAINVNKECKDEGINLACEKDDESMMTEEYGNNSNVNEECIYDGINSTDKDYGTRVNEECKNNSKNEICGDDEINIPCEEDNDRMNECENSGVNEECADDRIETREENNERTMNEVGIEKMVNKEHGEIECKLTYEEDDDIIVNQACTDEGSMYTNEEKIRRPKEGDEEGSIDDFYDPEDIIEMIEKDDELNECGVDKATEKLQDDACLEEMSLLQEEEKREAQTRKGRVWEKHEGVQGSIDHVEDDSRQMNESEEENLCERLCNHAERTDKEVAGQESHIAVDVECRQMEKEVLNTAEHEAGGIERFNPVEEASIPDGDGHIMLEISDYSSESDLNTETSHPLDEAENMEVTNPSSEPKMDVENLVFSHLASDLIHEEEVLRSVSGERNGIVFGVGYESDLKCWQTNISGEAMQSELEDIQINQTNHLNEPGKTLNVEESVSDSDQEGKKGTVEAVHRRRRWFDNTEEIGAAHLNILDGDQRTSLQIEQEVLVEPESAESVLVHVDEKDIEDATAKKADSTPKQDDSQSNIEVNHKRRQWFDQRGEEGVLEPPSLFSGTKIASEMDHDVVDDDPSHHHIPDGDIDELNTISRDASSVFEVVDGEMEKKNVEVTPRRKRWFESGEMGPTQQLRSHVDAETTVETAKLKNVSNLDGKDNVHNEVKLMSKHRKDLDAMKRKKEKHKERIAVAKAIREARERAFSDARERARRDAANRPNMEAQQKVRSVTIEEGFSSHKASMDEQLKPERTAAERATKEARKRALHEVLSEKASQKSQEHPIESSSVDPNCHDSSSNSRCPDFLNNDEKFEGADGESVQRHKAAFKRQNRTVEQAVKAREEKNKQDLFTEKKQAARDIFADALDAEIRRWSCGKEGNVRALLSTLQYILGSESGWQAVSLIDLMTATDVRKAYKKATLCVHPDKLQQRGATIQQKYICEKVFNLLKDGWSKFNPEKF